MARKLCILHMEDDPPQAEQFRESFDKLLAAFGIAKEEITLIQVVDTSKLKEFQQKGEYEPVLFVSDNDINTFKMGVQALSFIRRSFPEVQVVLNFYSSGPPQPDERKNLYELGAFITHKCDYFHYADHKKLREWFGDREKMTADLEQYRQIEHVLSRNKERPPFFLPDDPAIPEMKNRNLRQAIAEEISDAVKNETIRRNSYSMPHLDKNIPDTEPDFLTKRLIAVIRGQQYGWREVLVDPLSGQIVSGIILQAAQRILERNKVSGAAIDSTSLSDARPPESGPTPAA